MTHLMKKAIDRLPDRLSALPEDKQDAIARFLLEGDLQQLATQAEEGPPAASLRHLRKYTGEIWMADDFDEPLEDFEPYMS